MSPLPKKLVASLQTRKEKQTERKLVTTGSAIDFLSNDYLGFAKNATIFSKTFQLLLTQGIADNGSGGSRLLSGNHKLYGMLEQQLATFYKAETALVFNSGYDANLGFFGAVPQRGDLVFYDEYIHASIREGIRMSHAKSYSFAHNDLESLSAKVDQTLKNEGAAAKEAAVYVVTESVFSMDGDSPDLKKLASYTSASGYYLVVDEAHAVGVQGKDGVGLVPELKLQNSVFARTVTFGKAFGCHGAAVLGSEALRDYLVNFAKPLIYSTALPPHALATIISSHQFYSTSGNDDLAALHENIAFFKSEIKKQKLDNYFLASATQIQCCVISGAAKAKKVAAKIMGKGFNVKAIVAPTVPEGQERLRFCLHSYNSKEEMGLVLKLLSTYMT